MQDLTPASDPGFAPALTPASVDLPIRHNTMTGKLTGNLCGACSQIVLYYSYAYFSIKPVKQPAKTPELGGLMVRSTIIAQYTQPHQMDPLLPQNRLDELRSRSARVIERSYNLANAAHVSTIASVRELVREMNSYYSNRIEGQSTHPANIKRALQQDFSDKPETAKLQRLALAHIEAERELEREGVVDLPRLLSSEFLLRAHAALYGRLSDADRTTEDGRIVQPGHIRIEQVAVGRHEPPPGEFIPRFLARLDEGYGRPCPIEDKLFTIASVHQRVAWVHPFSDGNGRASRLQTHCALFPISAGLWSVSRGLARKRDRYYALLEAADCPRQGDLDGRGNLGEKALWAWCAWFIEICEDQVDFMGKMLDIDGVKTRISALISFLSSQDKRVRMEAALPLYHLFLAGPTPRGEFQQMTGLQDRTARSLLSRLAELGLVTADSHVAPVRVAFPLNTLQFLFPDLYPEAATFNIDE